MKKARQRTLSFSLLPPKYGQGLAAGDPANFINVFCLAQPMFYARPPAAVEMRLPTAFLVAIIERVSVLI
jgi:hypothetical protein